MSDIDDFITILEFNGSLTRSGDTDAIDHARDLMMQAAGCIRGLNERIENAGQAMSETHSSWEQRCHAITAAIGFDFGGETPDMPEQNSWYARQMRLKEQRIAELEGMIKPRQSASVSTAALGIILLRLIEAAEGIRKWANPSGVDPEIDADYRKFDEVLAKIKGSVM